MISFQNNRLQYFLKYVTTIQVPFTLEKMKENVDTGALESICENELGPDTPAQCILAGFVDANRKPILFYFGARIRGPDNELGVSISFHLSVSRIFFSIIIHFYITEREVRSISDGLSESMLCYTSPKKFDRTRHEGTNLMSFNQEEEGEINPDAYDVEDTEDSGVKKNVQARVAHLVHAWILPIFL